MARNPAAYYGRDVACVLDADELFSSPSKLMASYGENTAAGMAHGIDAGASAVQASATAMASGADIEAMMRAIFEAESLPVLADIAIVPAVSVAKVSA